MCSVLNIFQEDTHENNTFFINLAKGESQRPEFLAQLKTFFNVSGMEDDG